MMKDWSEIRARYLRDSVPVRLGGLATNLGRIRSFAGHEASREAVASLMDESKQFIEWTAAQMQIEVAAELVELQVQLARWQANWNEIWNDPIQRRLLAESSKQWSNRLLALSGLLSD